MWRKLKQKIFNWQGVLISTPTVAGFVIGISSVGLFQLLEWVVLDQFFQLRPLEPVDPRIVIVTIDESDINKVGQWPIPDAQLAQLLQTLNAQQPRAIGLDLYRDLPVQPGYQALVEVFKSTPNLVGVEKVVGNTVEPPPVLNQLDQVAMADMVLDADGKVRRGLLSVELEDGSTQLSLGAKLALMYLEAEGITLEPVAQKQLRLGKAVFVPFQGNEGGYVRADAGGYQILLNYRGAKKNFRTVSLTEVLENRIPPDLVRDKIVLIGATGQSANDLFFTPYSTTPIGSRQQMPGVVVHANLTSQIVSAAKENRPLIRVLPDPLEWLWVGVWSLMGAGGSWAIIRAEVWKVSWRWTVLGISIFLTGSSLIAGSYLAFLASWWLPLVSPLVALTGSAIAIAIYQSWGWQRYTSDLEILLETTTAHSDVIEAELHRQAEEAARESERRLAQFLEAVPVGVTVLDANGKVYFINQRAQELYGKSIVPSTTSEHLSEVYQAYIAGTNQLYPTEKLPIVQALQGKSSTTEDIELHQGSSIIPLEIWGTPIYDEAGKITYAIAAFQDITERKRAEEALKQAEQKYRSIFENALEGIFQITPDGHYISANPALAQLYGYDSPEELIATLTHIQHQLYVDPHCYTEFILLMQKHGAISGFESQVYRRDGSIIWIRENARAIRNANGALLYYQGFVEDITQRKQAEAERLQFTNQLYQLNRAYKRFVPEEFLQLLDKDSIVDVQLGEAVQKEMSILFADIRNFTTLSEKISLEENFKFINAYLSRMAPAIVENNGFIDKYIGDAIMALFSGSVDDAVKAAISMLRRLARYNTTRTRPERPPIHIGIGINTGSLMLGTVGGHHRMDSTVISDAVNLAARLEELTKKYGVSLLISHHTFWRLQDATQYAIRLIERVQVKGKSEMVSVFEVFDADPPELKQGKLMTKSLFEEALLLYHLGHFKEAAQRFEECLQVVPSDRVTQIYRERCYNIDG
ncbi:MULTISPECIES: CHASE2 domain-containing protein [unclassified Coleofasciculus]|uniref:CHASE2 domain-containing protein n=1 Tax=unclassified Coleofasciculus TaxID=2692782 RepID=UPI001D156656|nr:MULTISPECIES: CHASE2 domain-containing protein [unclassified Coleofasciculus]